MDESVMQILKTEGALELNSAFETLLSVLDSNSHTMFDNRLDKTALRLICKVLPIFPQDCKMLKVRLISYLLKVKINDDFCALLWAQSYVICKALCNKGESHSCLKQLSDKLLQDNLLRVHAIELLGGEVDDENLLPLINDLTIHHLVPGQELTDTFL